MTRTSRNKSHKQSKHSSREYSDVNEDGKMKETNDISDGKENGVSVKISTDSLVSAEKWKKNVNGNVSDEFSTPTKRRKENIHGVIDRWDDDDGEDEGEVVNIDDIDLNSNDLLKAFGDPKSKTSRKHDVDEESRRKKLRNGKHEVEVLPKQFENLPSERERELDEWPIEEELRNIELEKELKRRMKRREGYHDSRKQENKHHEDGERDRQREKKHREDREKDRHREHVHREDDNRYKKDKHREDVERDHRQKNERSEDVKRYKNDKHREDIERDHRHKNERSEDDNRYKKDKHREDSERDHRHKKDRSQDDLDRKTRVRDSDHRDAKKLKDDHDYDRKSNNRGGSSSYDDQVSRHKDKRDNSNNNNKDQSTDNRSREAEKRSACDAKIKPISGRCRSSSRENMEITSSHMRLRSSSSGKVYPPRDHHRGSKQEETKYKNDVRENKAHHSVSRDQPESEKFSSRSMEKNTKKEENRVNDLSAEKRLKSDSRFSPSSTSKISSFLPPQSPFKAVSDRPLTNFNRGLVGPNLGTTLPNWNNWASPLANSGYIPFHNIPPPMFNPIMQQYPSPMFGGLQMNMNNAGFYGHGLHGWQSNNSGFGNYDLGITQLNNQIWESSDDIWKGQGLEVDVDMQSASLEDDLVHGPTDEIRAGETSLNIENEQNQLDNNTPEVMKVKECSPVSVVKKDDDNFISRVYLSKIGISEDLTRPELYEQCTNILGVDQASASDESDCKILYLEKGGDANISKGASLFGATDDSVFKKAMSLYAKHKVLFSATGQEGALNGIGSISDRDLEKSCPVDDVKLVEKALKGPLMELSQNHIEPQVKNLDMNPLNKDMEADHLVENQEKKTCAPSVGGCEVKVEGVEKPGGGGGSLSVLTNVLGTELSEFEWVDMSRMHQHSRESAH